MNYMYMGYGGYYNQGQQGAYNNRPSSTNSQTQQAVNLIGRHVKINRGGPEVVEGLLIAVPADFLVLSSVDGIIYVNGSHVKSITEGSKSNQRSRSHRFITASSFQSLLGKMNHQFIQINRGGPEKIEGFLAEVNSQFLLLIVGREFVRVPVFHIKTVNITTDGNKSGNKSGSSSGGSSGNKSGSKSSNKSGSKSSNKSGSSGGNRSRSGSGGNRSRSGSGGNRSRSRTGNNRSGSGGNRRSGRT